MQFARGYSQGTERYLSILRDGLHARGHDTHVLAGDPERRGEPQALGELIVGADRVRACPTAHWAAVEGTPPIAYGPMLDELQPDVVHVVNPGHIGLGLAVAATERRIPLVFTTMDYWWICPKHTLRHYQTGVCDGARPVGECLACVAAERDDWRRNLLPLPAVVRTPLLGTAYAVQWRRHGMTGEEIARFRRRQAYIDTLLGRAAAVIFPSQTAQRLIGGRVAATRGVRIPYGLEPRWFGNERAPRTRGGAGPVIGFAGALVAHKGPDVLIGAIKGLGWREARVRIAGGGDEAFVAQLKQQASGLNVEFVGRVSPDQMPAFMASLDVLVVPSLWPENLPFVVLESYAVGTPVIASDVGGIAEIVEDPAKRFPIGSADGLATCLRIWSTGDAIAPLPRICTADEMTAATERVYVRECAAADGG